MYDLVGNYPYQQSNPIEIYLIATQFLIDYKIYKEIKILYITHPYAV